MSGNVIGTATIKIVPDVSQFTPQLTAAINQALNIAQAQWKQGFEDMEQAVRELIAVVKMEMAEVRTTVEMTAADIADEFNRGLERAETAVQTSGEAIETAIRETGAQAEITGERIERAFAEAGRKSDGHMSRMGGAMGGMLKGGAMAGAAAVGYLGVSAFQAGLDMTGSFDKAQASFTALTGSVKEGDILLDKVKDFAFKTPFDVKQVADQTRNLLAQGQAYGVTKDNVLDYAKAIGDAVALTGGGETEFQRVTRALGQMGSSSKVMAQDMNQLQQSIPGINVWKELGEGLGVTEAEARDMGQAGLIPGAKAANILTEAMREMPGAAGEMERQAATVTGALQNFKEQATSTLTEGMRPFTDALRTFLSSSEAKEAIGQLGAGFGQLLAAMAPVFPVITQLASTFGSFLGALGTALTPFLNTLGPIMVDLFKQLEGPLTIVAETFGILLSAIAPLLPVITTLITIGANLIGTVLKALQPALKAIGDAFTKVAEVIGPVLEELGSQLGPLLGDLAAAFGQLVIALVPLIPVFVELIVALLPLLLPLLPVIIRFITAFATVLAKIVTVGASVIQILAKGLIPIVGFLAKVIGLLVSGILGGLTWAFEKLVGFATWILDLLQKYILDPILRFFGIASPSTVMMEIGGDIIQGMIDGIQALAGLIWDFFSTMPGKILGFLVSLGSMLFNLAGTVIRFLWNGFTAYIGLVWTFWTSIVPRILGFLASLPGRIFSFAAGVIRFLWNGLSSMLGWLSTQVSTLPGKIIGFIGNIASKMLSVGKDVVEGIWDGISNKIGWLGEKVSGFASGVVKKFKDAFKIFSPSQLMADEIGAPMAEGVAVGFQEQMKSFAPGLSGDMNVTAIGAAAGGSAAGGGITFNGPVSFGSDASSSVAELDWMRRTRMGAA